MAPNILNFKKKGKGEKKERQEGKSKKGRKKKGKKEVLIDYFLVILLFVLNQTEFKVVILQIIDNILKRNGRVSGSWRVSNDDRPDDLWISRF